MKGKNSAKNKATCYGRKKLEEALRFAEATFSEDENTNEPVAKVNKRSSRSKGLSDEELELVENELKSTNTRKRKASADRQKGTQKKRRNNVDHPLEAEGENPEFAGVTECTDEKRFICKQNSQVSRQQENEEID